MMPNWIGALRAGRAAHLVLAVCAMLVSGCFHAGPSVKQSMTSGALDVATAGGSTLGGAVQPQGGSAQAKRDGAFDLHKPEVEIHVAAFQTQLRGFFDRAIERGARYVPSMRSILEREGLPPDLAYLPLIESGYRTEAVSPAGAAGPWQFIPETGRRYGLRIDSLVDERRDPIKSTHAAVQYLKDLHDMFGDWQLSLAAYNTGEMRVARILASKDVDDFWDMRQRGYLPSETRDYVPSFLAAVRIARAPSTYGFSMPDSEPPIEFETVDVDRQVSLRTAADMCGVAASELAELNPALRRGITPSGYSLRVPTGKAEPLRAALASYVEPVRARPVVARASTVNRREARIAESRRGGSRVVARASGKPSSVALAERAPADRKTALVAPGSRRVAEVCRRRSLDVAKDTPTKRASSRVASARDTKGPPAKIDKAKPPPRGRARRS